MNLDSDKLLKLLDNDGLICRFLPNYEQRVEQREMMRKVIDAFNNKHIALVEAGTGTGKSMAYLIPAMISANLFKEKVVISTNTISLQEQLLNKDIPLIANALGIKLKAALVKGMNNYVCLRKLEDSAFDKPFLPKKEQEELEQIELHLMSQKTDGSRSKLPFAPSPATWELVGAEHDTCNHNECPHYQNCTFFQARRQAQDASLLIVNHHLLFADLAMRGETQNYTLQAILPAYDRLILDEAHNIEDIATDYFAERLSRLELLRTLGKLNSEKSTGRLGKLAQLRDKLTMTFLNNPSHEASLLLNRLTLEIPAVRRDLLKAIADAFQDLHFMVSKNSEDFEEGKLRLLESHVKGKDWQEKVLVSAKELLNILMRYISDLNGIEQDIKNLGSDKILDQTKSIRLDIKALAKRLEDSHALLDSFLKCDFNSQTVHWLESEHFRGSLNTSLVRANLDISEMLKKRLFSKFSTIVLCSATLTTNRKFDFLRSRLGLTPPFTDDREVTENIYDSPFDFTKQMLLLIPQDLPSPSQASFTEKAAESIFQAILASKGCAFVLFTSYVMLKACARLLREKMAENRLPLLVQGEESRTLLLDKFKKTDRAVLFGTDSFWEGVDVVGDALRCVIIVKLPFRVPSDPLAQARAETLINQNKDPFMTYFMPQAIVKFKQGFGRLIRNKEDRGCIVCLDNRLVNKSYGKFFLNSLPSCKQIIGPSQLLKNCMIDFYKKT